MMHRFLAGKRMLVLAVTLLAAIATASAQSNNPLINSGEILEKGVKLYDDHEYKKAIALFEQVPASDTNYNKVLHELLLSYYADSNFLATQKWAYYGLKRFPNEKFRWFNHLANALDDLGKSQEALAIYDSILINYPNQESAWFNKGVTYNRLEKYKDAEKCFQQCLLINPYYASAHYFLGKIALEQYGNAVPAMLSFMTNLLVNSSNRYMNRSVKYLNYISNVTKEVNDYLKKYKATSTDNFDMQHEILVNKVALDKNYKLKIDIEDAITRQIQVLLEKLEYNAGDKGFWMQFYVPLYEKLYKEKLYEPMAMLMFSDLNIKSVQDYQKRNKKEIETMSNVVVNYFNEIKFTRTLAYNKRADVKVRYFFSNGHVMGKGQYGYDKKNNIVPNGPWEFFYENGNVSAKGNFNDAGEKEGLWQYFYENNVKKEESSYSNGIANGNTTVWHDNGLMYIRVKHVQDKYNGLYESWFYNGLKRSEEMYVDGKKNGPYKYYNLRGILTSSGTYENDELSGEQTTYHPNGKKSYISNYTKDVEDGNYKSFYESGKVKYEGKVVKGKREGISKEFYEDGKPKSEYNYLAGEVDGPTVEYHENGKISQKAFYKKGKLEGKIEDFDDDGIVYREITYERGRLRDVKFYDKKGNVISNTTSRKGDATIVYYDPQGHKLSETYFSREGLKEGKATLYYTNGKLQVEENYKNGMLEGPRKTYFLNGKISEEGTYKEDEPDGYFKYYYLNGKLKSEGWYVAGQKQGTHLEYNIMGDLEGKVYYLNDKQYGFTEYFHPNGKLDYTQRFEYDWLEQTSQFDSSGNVLSDFYLPQGSGKLEWKHLNGKDKYLEITYDHYFKNGPSIVYYKNGKTSRVQYYKQGALDSTYKSYSEAGKLDVEGKYLMGDRVGTWKYYYDNGQTVRVEEYKDGYETGIEIQYNEDGTKDKEISYKDGKLDGPYKMFADKNKLAVIINYKDGEMVSYTYEGKDGKLVAPIALPDGTGKIVAYFSNGNKAVEMEAELSYINGKRTLYFSNGKVYVEGLRIYNNDHGSKKVYNENGTLDKEENYEMDELHGPRKLYHENGKIKAEENWYSGNKHGIYKLYDATGKLIETKQYFYGYEL